MRGHGGGKGNGAWTLCECLAAPNHLHPRTLDSYLALARPPPCVCARAAQPASVGEGMKTLAELFSSQGYETAIVGKHHLGGQQRRLSKPNDVWEEEEHDVNDIDHQKEWKRGPSKMGYASPRDRGLRMISARST